MTRKAPEPALPLGLARPEHDHAGQWSLDQQADLDRQRLALASASPLRGRAAQHDESDLALFRSVDEQELPL